MPPLPSMHREIFNLAEIAGRDVEKMLFNARFLRSKLF